MLACQDKFRRILLRESKGADGGIFVQRDPQMLIQVVERFLHFSRKRSLPTRQPSLPPEGWRDVPVRSHVWIGATHHCTEVGVTVLLLVSPQPNPTGPTFTELVMSMIPEDE